MTISILGQIGARFANAFLNVSGNGLLLMIIALVFFMILLAMLGADFALSLFIMMGVAAVLATYAGLPQWVYFIGLAIGGVFVMMALAKIMRR